MQSKTRITQGAMRISATAAERTQPSTRRVAAQAATVLAALAGSEAACGNDLMDVYRLAQSHDAVLQAATGQRDAAIEAHPQALAQWLPQISATASAGRDREGFQVAPLGAGNLPIGCSLGSSTQNVDCYTNIRTYGLTLNQTLWDYGAFSRLREASAQVASAEATLLAAQQNLLLRVASAYFGVLSARDVLDTAKGARAAYSSMLEQTKTRERIGVGARSEVDQAQSYYDGTEQTVIDAQNALDDAVLTLTEIIGQAPPQLSPLRENIPLTSPDPASVDSWVASARSGNPTVRAAELTAQAADRDIGVQRGKGLPTFSLTGTTSKTYQDATFGGDERLDSAGVQFSWPLFQGGQVASAVRQARATFRQSQATFDTAQRDTERMTRAAYRGVVTGIGRIGAARHAVDSARAAVDATQRNLQFGTGDVFELLQSQTRLYTAQRLYLQTRYDYLTAVLTLKQQAGNITEHDLETIDGLLVSRAQ